MRSMIRFVALVLLPLSVSACASLQAPPSVSTSAVAGSQYMFRGVPQVEATVYQGDMAISVSDDRGGTYSLATWVNLDGSNDTGDAVLPEGNGGKITEVDFVPEYSREFDGWSAAIGLCSYNFPNGVGSSTTEAYLSATWDVLLSPTLTANWDFDQVEGLYLQADVSHGWALTDRVDAEAGASLGHADEDQGLAYWGDDSSGLSHLEGMFGVSYAWSNEVALFASVHAASIVSDDFEDALDDAGIETNNVWFMIGVGWGM
jgi:hypothetical protein